MVSIPLGPLSPLNDLAGVLVQQYADDLDKNLELVFQQELAEAKEQGLDYLKKFVDSWGRSNDYKYQLLPISTETSNKLLQGEFKKISELEAFENSLEEDLLSKIYLLTREVKNKDRDEDIVIVESLIINI